jgi:hypothetical protein
VTVAGGYLRSGGRSRGAGGVWLVLRALLRLQAGRELLGSWLGPGRELLGSWLEPRSKLLGSGSHPLLLLLLLAGSAAAEGFQLSLVGEGKEAASVLSVAPKVESSGALAAAVEGGPIGDPAVHAVPQVGAYCDLVDRQYQHGLQHQHQHKQQTSSYTAVHWVAGGECCCMIIQCIVAGTWPRGELAALGGGSLHIT